MQDSREAEVRQLALAIRRTVLEQSKRANVGHIGSSLSIADILASLYGGVLDGRSGAGDDRDRFILSKGHAVLSLYAALSATGRIQRELLGTYCSDGSALGGHPEHSLEGVEFSTGSLGHGLSIGVGAALGARLAGSARRIFVLMSDAECNEGSVWEAAMFAAHHGLTNLIAIVDDNGQQAMGPTRHILDLSPLEARWQAFGWDATSVDGHDTAALVDALDGPPPSASGAPRILIARTVFGKGISYMERQVKWHYWPMSDEDYATALAELDRIT